MFSLWHACEANRNTIANKTLRTGSVFHGYLDYAKTHNDERLKVGCLENVEGLSDGPFPTNLDCVNHLLGEHGIWVLSVFMDPSRMLASKVSRRRYWLPHALEKRLSHVPEGDRIHLFLTAIGIIIGASDTIELNTLLLPEEHHIIKNLYTELENKKVSPHSAFRTWIRKTRRRVSTWPMKHAEIAAAQGKDWTQLEEPTQELIMLYPGILQLSSAEISLLQLHDVKYPETESRSIDVSQSAGRGHMKTNAISCVKPKWKNWVTDRCRLTTGVESFHLQGIHFGNEHHKLNTYPDSFLTELSGNAFEVSDCQAMELCVDKEPIQNRRLGNVQPGYRFVPFVLAYARSGCLVELDQKFGWPAFSLFPFGRARS